MNNIKLNSEISNEYFIIEDLWNLIISFISKKSYSSLRNLKYIRLTSKLFYKISNKFIYLHRTLDKESKFEISELFKLNSLEFYYLLNNSIISSIFSKIKSFQNLEYLILLHYKLKENEFKELPTSITSLSLRNIIDFSKLSNILTLIVFNPFSSKDIKLIPTKLKYLKFNIKEEDWNQQNIDQLPLSINSLIFNNK